MDTLTRIRAFIDVVEAEGFSAAARKVGRSKALLSKYVRELEDDLGALLLNRTTRQFSLTEAGHTYYRSASDILKEIDSLADLVRQGSKDIKGRIRVSAPRTFADAAIGRSLTDFAAAFPDITLEIISDDRFVDLVEEGYDIAIRITRLEDSGLIARKLSNFSLVACASPDFLKRHGPITHPSQLANVPCVLDTNNRTLNTWHFQDKNGSLINVATKVQLEANSPLVCRRAAEAGLGVTILPDFIYKEHANDGALETILDDYIAADRGIYAIYPHRRYLPAKVRAFVDFLTQWFKTHQ